MFVRPKVLDVLPQMLWDIREELCSESLKFFFFKKKAEHAPGLASHLRRCLQARSRCTLHLEATLLLLKAKTQLSLSTVILDTKFGSTSNRSSCSLPA